MKAVTINVSCGHCQWQDQCSFAAGGDPCGWWSPSEGGRQEVTTSICAEIERWTTTPFDRPSSYREATTADMRAEAACIERLLALLPPEERWIDRLSYEGRLKRLRALVSEDEAGGGHA